MSRRRCHPQADQPLQRGGIVAQGGGSCAMCHRAAFQYDGLRREDPEEKCWLQG